VATINRPSAFAPIGRPAPTRTDTNQQLQQVRVRQQIVERLIAGTISLRQAVSEFSASRPRFLLNHGIMIAKSVGSGNDNEWEMRTLLGWVQLALADRLEQAEPVLARLECELQACLRAAVRSTPSRRDVTDV
jgi:hypothetical protein